MTDYVIPILIIIVLILLNGLFVAAEFAIIGVRPTRIDQLVDEGNHTAKTIQQTLKDPTRTDRYISTAQLGITIASLGLGMYGEHVVAAWLLGPFEAVFALGEETAHAIAAGVAIALLTFAHVVVGEMVPKSLALQYAERTALGITGIMTFMARVFYPAVLLLNAIGNAVLRLLGIPRSDPHSRLYSPEELEMVVTESYAGGLLTNNQEQLLHNIFDFGERHIGQVMTPRTRVEAIPLTISETELRAKLAASPYSRFPVYDRDLDHVVGLLLLKDFVRQQLQAPGKLDLKALLRHMPVIPEATPVERLLASFKRSHVHMALVVDEYGGTAGVVTLEDLVEEVVGEVHDEFDQAEVDPLVEVGPNAVLARGDLLLDDLFENTPIPRPSSDKLPDVETVGGLVVALLGRPPKPQDSVELHSLTFTVERVVGLAVILVRVSVSGRPGQDESSDTAVEHSTVGATVPQDGPHSAAEEREAIKQKGAN